MRIMQTSTLVVTIVLVLAAAGGLIFWLGRRNAQLDQRVKDHARAVEVAVHAAVASHKRELAGQDTIVRLRSSQQQHGVESERAQHSIDSLESVITEQLRLGPDPELPGPATIRDTMNHFRRLYLERTEQMQRALVRIRSDSLHILDLEHERDFVTVERDSARAERDRALQLAVAGVEIATCRYDLVIVKPKCLSRNASFVAGAIVSSAVWLVARPKDKPDPRPPEATDGTFVDMRPHFPEDGGIPLRGSPARDIR